MARNKEAGEAMLAVAAGMPGLLLQLLRSYLRMRRHSKKARQGFYRSLVQNGVPPHDANKLADEYIEVTRITFWLRKFAFPSASEGIRQGIKESMKEK